MVPNEVIEYVERRKTMDEFYTIAEIQKLLKIGKNQAYNLCKRDDFPAVRVGLVWRVPKREFEKWVAKQSYRE